MKEKYKRAIMCIETGESFESVASAVRWLDGEKDSMPELSSLSSRLTKHLNKTPIKTNQGYMTKIKSIYGYTFKDVDTKKTPKTARELFEDLGYVLTKETKYRRVWKLSERYTINFESMMYFISDNPNKDWRCAVEKYNGKTMELHKAIHQQLRELGWL